MHVVHLGAELKCGACHAQGFARATVVPCDDCHHEATAPLHLAGAEKTPACVDCHRFRADTSIEPWACGRCHQRDLTKHRAHVEQDCATCHAPHAPSKVDCTTCHKDQHPAPPKHACTSCHAPHGSKESARASCASCHAKAGLFDGGHQLCTDCHTAHRAKPKPCASCHALVTSPKHETCTGCHQPHQVAEVSCAKCHAKTVVSHRAEGTLDALERCSTCHQPHTKTQPPPIAAQCTSCHQVAKRDDGLHDGKTTCAKCHDKHGFSGLPEGSALCASCHEDQVAHASCLACHPGGAHQPAPAPAERSCARCHAAEASNIPRGHAECSRCHEPHAGKIRSTLACSTCHFDQSKTKHTRCEDCHRPHDVAAPPKCVSCHLPSALPGLHTVSQHQECASCHRAHDATPPLTRDACTSCHEEQLAHQPRAQSCSSCHPFSATPRAR